MGTVTLTDDDDGARVRVAVGDVVEVRLLELPGAAYLWTLESSNPDVVAIGESDYLAHVESGIGGGARRVFSLAAARPGSARVLGRLARPWEGGGEAANSFELSVEVEP